MYSRICKARPAVYRTSASNQMIARDTYATLGNPQYSATSVVNDTAGLSCYGATDKQRSTSSLLNTPKTSRKITSKFRNAKEILAGCSAPLRVYPTIETWTETDTLTYLRQTRVFAQEVIAKLAEMSDFTQPAMKELKIRHTLRAHSPYLLKIDEGTAQSSTDEIVTELTSFDYGARNTEKIALFLCAIAQRALSLALNRETYNRAIGFFAATNDIHMANMWLHLLLKKSRPDRATMHALLAFQAMKVSANPYPRGSIAHPLLSTQKTLELMAAAGVRADECTWNWVLQCMPLGFGKSFVVEEMDRRSIPLNAASRAQIANIIVAHRSSAEGKHEIDELPALLRAMDSGDPVFARAVIDKVLIMKSEGNINVLRALDLLIKNPDTSTDTLNVFLYRFGKRHHVDWQFGVLAHFPSTQWNPQSWQSLLESASFSRNTPHKPGLLGTILMQAQRESVPLTPRARYLARRAAKLSLRDYGPEAWNTLKQQLQWVSPFQPKNPDLLAAIGFGEGSSIDMPSTEAKLDPERYRPLARTDTKQRRDELAFIVHKFGS